jgi:hypothetical protein
VAVFKLAGKAAAAMDCSAPAVPHTRASARVSAGPSPTRTALRMPKLGTALVQSAPVTRAAMAATAADDNWKEF